jgi:uncharacterized protein (TIGR02594 family)
MLSRRHLLGAAPLSAGSILTAAALPAAAQTTGDFGFDIPDDWQFHGPDSLAIATVSETKRGREIARSIDILRDIPVGADAFGVARYFEGINLYNDNCLSYTQEWQSERKGPSNPIVVMFHTLTNTMPNPEDSVAWCAAFVSFCLYAGRMKSLWTCRSQDYRDYDGLNTLADPRPGDIVVFKNRHGGGGHVSFFVEWDRDPSGKKTGVRCLGGNQGDRIKVSTYAFAGSKELVAIRRPKKAPIIVEKKVCARG